MTVRNFLRKRGPNLLLLGFSSLLAFAFGEVVVRLVAPQALTEDDRFYCSDPELGWALTPNDQGTLSNQADFATHVRINRFGLRGGEPEGRHPAILGVGDSFMFGYGVEEDQAFLSVAAARLGGEPLNAGVPGYDLCQAVDLAARVAKQVPPDAIVLAVFAGNDEHDTSLGRFRMVVQEGGFYEPGKERQAHAWRRRLMHPIFAHSHLIRLIRFSPWIQDLEAWLFGRPSLNRRALSGLLETFEEPPPEAVVEGDREIRECLPRLRDVGEAAGAPVVAILIPDRLQIHPETLPAQVEAADLGDLRFDVEAPDRRLRALFTEAGIPLVELLDRLRAEEAAGRKLFFKVDRHLNVDGSRLVGELLADTLRPYLEGAPETDQGSGREGA